jgi:hypothetical protein
MSADERKHRETGKIEALHEAWLDPTGTDENYWRMNGAAIFRQRMEQM